MFDALATLPFLVSLWLVLSLAAEMIARNWPKIAAALAADAVLKASPKLCSPRRRTSCRARPPLQAEPRWRAAA